jgi:hypothetical protein
MYSVFISYRREDEKAALNLRQALEREYDVYFDRKCMQPGDDFPTKLSDALAQCVVLIVVIDSYWVRRIADLHRPGDWACLEIQTMLDKNALVIPVLWEAQMPGSGDLPANIADLARKQAVAVNAENFDSKMAEVLAQIAKQDAPRKTQASINLDRSLKVPDEYVRHTIDRTEICETLVERIHESTHTSKPLVLLMQSTRPGYLSSFMARCQRELLSNFDYVSDYKRVYHLLKEQYGLPGNQALTAESLGTAVSGMKQVRASGVIFDVDACGIRQTTKMARKLLNTWCTAWTHAGSNAKPGLLLVALETRDRPGIFDRLWGSPDKLAEAIESQYPEILSVNLGEIEPHVRHGEIDDWLQTLDEDFVHCRRRLEKAIEAVFPEDDEQQTMRKVSYAIREELDNLNDVA